eukprot:113605-Chlamydomonas_euryale.AAC.2
MDAGGPLPSAAFAAVATADAARGESKARSKEERRKEKKKKKAKRRRGGAGTRASARLLHALTGGRFGALGGGIPDSAAAALHHSVVLPLDAARDPYARLSFGGRGGGGAARPSAQPHYSRLELTLPARSATVSAPRQPAAAASGGGSGAALDGGHGAEDGAEEGAKD